MPRQPRPESTGAFAPCRSYAVRMSELHETRRPTLGWWSLLIAAMLVAVFTALLSLSFATVCTDTSTATSAISDCRAAGVTLSIDPAGWVAFTVAAAALAVAIWRLVATRR